MALTDKCLNFDSIFLTLLLYGKDSYLDKTKSVTRQTYLNQERFFFFNFLFKDLFQRFICLLSDNVKTSSVATAYRWFLPGDPSVLPLSESNVCELFVVQSRYKTNAIEAFHVVSLFNQTRQALKLSLFLLSQPI
jgi:hypothetical protein